MSITLYVEGGGSKGKLKTDCRKAFQSFIKRAGVKQKVNVVACGGRGNAFNSFKIEHREGRETVLLLVDAEGPVTTQNAWQHLKGSDSWDRPTNATDDQCHLMVQVMESWFLADDKTLESFFGVGFRRRALSGNPNIEDVPKEDVENRLKRASRDTGPGEYKKGKHSFDVLAKLDPEKVRKASPHANRLIEFLLS